MSKKTKSRPAPVIEIDDSTDNDDDADSSTNTSDSNIPLAQCRLGRKRTTIAAKKSPKVTLPKESSTSSLAQSTKKTTATDEFEIPKRIMNRRKSVHHSIRSTEDLSFEFPTPRKRRESDDNVVLSKKKQHWDESQIDDAVDKNVDDPEIDQVLKKIAYCRVFTNYLLRQYDMLAIDFKLYSNLDLLNLDLNMRVDTYKAIKKSRQCFKEALERNGQIKL